jgi:cysteinyl-tRNA synthetase
MRYLGDYYDIHCAGRELVFPHHENEIAIAGALTGKTLAKYWIHCDRVLVDGKKVDEKGDALTIQALLDMGYTGREIRFWLLSVNYRKPVLFSESRLDRVRKTLARLDACVRALKNVRQGERLPGDRSAVLRYQKRIYHGHGRRPEHFRGTGGPVRCGQAYQYADYKR